MVKFTRRAIQLHKSAPPNLLRKLDYALIDSEQVTADCIGDYAVYEVVDGETIGLVHIPSGMHLLRVNKDNCSLNGQKYTKATLKKQLKATAVLCSELEVLNIDDRYSPVWKQLQAIVTRARSEKLT